MIITNKMLEDKRKGAFSTGATTHNGVPVSSNGKFIGYVSADTPMTGETENNLSGFDKSGIYLQVNLPRTTDVEVLGIRLVDYYKNNRKR